MAAENPLAVQVVKADYRLDVADKQEIYDFDRPRGGGMHAGELFLTVNRSLGRNSNEYFKTARLRDSLYDTDARYALGGEITGRSGPIEQ